MASAARSWTRTETFFSPPGVTLTHPGQTGEQTQESDGTGHFVFTPVAAGPFDLTITGGLCHPSSAREFFHPGEGGSRAISSYSIAAATTEVCVSVTNYELAEEQVKVEETQRVRALTPILMSVTGRMLRRSAPTEVRVGLEDQLSTWSPSRLAVHSEAQQAQNEFSGYGQGAHGYAKRYGAAYGDALIGTMIGGAILPSLLRQDPRYFYKGTGSTRSRILYALANAVICKGDNGHWQADYSGILGALAAGGISNLDHPAGSRNGAGLTFENTLIWPGRLGPSAISFRNFSSAS